MNTEFEKAKQEIGEVVFSARYRKVFDNVECLDYVKTIVFNLPDTCYAHCPYCIDKQLRISAEKYKSTIDIWLLSCQKALDTFPKFEKVCITGGTLEAKYFNKLIEMIIKANPKAEITWNTHGIRLNKEYTKYLGHINFINLHRNAADDKTNEKLFFTKEHVLTLEEAKELFKDKLTLRITMTEDFNLDDYLTLGCNLYVNRLLPGTKKSDEIYTNVVKRIEDLDSSDHRRRNVYLSGVINGIKVRVGCGDKLAEDVPGRKPTFLNVCIVHRTGKICGSWYEDDKVLYIPENNL